MLASPGVPMLYVVISGTARFPGASLALRAPRVCGGTAGTAEAAATRPCAVGHPRGPKGRDHGNQAAVFP